MSIRSINDEINDIKTVLQRHGDFAAPADERDEIAAEWYEYGFRPAAVDDWLGAGVFLPQAAEDLIDYNITPSEASRLSPKTVGLGSYTASLGYKYCNGDIVIDAVVDAVRKEVA